MFILNQFVDCIFNLTLTHLGQVTHICVGNLAIIGSDNGLSPGRHQAITWTNVGILLIGPLLTNFSEMLIEIYTFSFKKIHLIMSSGKWRPFYLESNVLKKVKFTSKYKWFFVQTMWLKMLSTKLQLSCSGINMFKTLQNNWIHQRLIFCNGQHWKSLRMQIFL